MSREKKIKMEKHLIAIKNLLNCLQQWNHKSLLKTVEMHQLHYWSFIGDGDCCDCKLERESVQEHDKKHLMQNHVIRNYTSAHSTRSWPTLRYHFMDKIFCLSQW